MQVARRSRPTLAWFHGLPGDTSSSGLRVELLSFTRPVPDAPRASISFRGGDAVARALRALAARHAHLAVLTLVVRPPGGTDECHRMSEVTVDGVSGTNDARTVSISFKNSFLVRCGWANPGPPPGAPPIQQGARVNKGWVYGLPGRGTRVPMELHVTGFIPPGTDGRMKVSLAESRLPDELRSLGDAPRELLILVLPDRGARRYIEYKLRRASVQGLASGNVVFQSSTIECLTGGVAPGAASGRSR